MSGKECPTCDSVYKNEHGMKIHHAKVHGESLRGKDVECDWCGEVFSRLPCFINNTKRNFCPNKDCLPKWLSENKSGENHPMWKGGSVTVSCDWCSDEKDVNPYEIRELNHHFCDQECHGKWLSENKSGEDSPHYNGMGFSNKYLTIRDALSNVSWDTIRHRHDKDGVCEHCGDKSNNRIALHHIIPVMSGGINEGWNFMELCATCHNHIEHYTKSFTEPHLSYDYHHEDSWEPQ